MLKAAFIFVADGANYLNDRSIVKTPSVELTTVGAKNYKDAILATKQLVSSGIEAIELCGGFGHVGTAKIVEAAGEKAVVGVVRFDKHPGLGFKSGDELF